MKKYKRLTKWETSKGVKCVKYWQYSQEQIAERLALLEDKIENGTLIELPCKVGDKFYQVVKGLPIYEWEVETIVFGNIYFPKKNYVITARRIKDLAHWKFWCEDFGETLFLTKAEAEKKLKELQNEDKHGYKRITEKLDIHITYKPNGYTEEYDDWELEVKINGESQTVIPFGEPLKDMTMKQLLAEVKDAVEELLGY